MGHHIDWPLLIAGVTIGIFAMGWWASLWYDDRREECPRAVLGYNCKGTACDHSPEALRSAYETMGKIYYRH